MTPFSFAVLWLGLLMLVGCGDNHSEFVTSGNWHSDGKHVIAFTIYRERGLRVDDDPAYVALPFDCTVDAYTKAVDSGDVEVEFWTADNPHPFGLDQAIGKKIMHKDVIAMGISIVTGGATVVNGMLECEGQK